MQIGVETARAVANKRVFVVDDDEINRAVLQFMLQDENETHDLPGIADAYAKAVQWPPNLLLLGLSVVERDPSVLDRVADRLAGARVLLVADAGRGEAAQAFVGHGAHGVLTKPLTVETVRRRVDGLLGLLKQPMIQLHLPGG
jgi:CheY-like chemotaxis protein